MWERIGKRFVFKSDNTEEIIKDEENRFFWTMKSLHWLEMILWKNSGSIKIKKPRS